MCYHSIDLPLSIILRENKYNSPDFKLFSEVTTITGWLFTVKRLIKCMTIYLIYSKIMKQRFLWGKKSTSCSSLQSLKLRASICSARGVEASTGSASLSGQCGTYFYWLVLSQFFMRVQYEPQSHYALSDLKTTQVKGVHSN